MQETDTHEQKKRKLRTFFGLCVLVYATNLLAKYPFHTALTDIVDSVSNSPDLVTLLNRIGVTTSKSTLDRYICEVGQQRAEEGPFKQLPPGVQLSYVVVYRPKN
jgi:hypothetical protein